jgi:hypothetical protein
MQSHAVYKPARFRVTALDLLFLAFLLAMVWAVVNGKQFSADGAYYFLSILQSKDFTHIAWHRQFASYVTQWPLVVGLHLGVSSPGLLRLFFGLGHLLAYPIAYVALRWQVNRGAEPALLYTYVFGLVSITLSSDFILMGEHQLLLPLGWPILAFLTLPRLFGLAESCIAVVLSLLMVRIYEPALFVFLSFFLVILTKGRRDLYGALLQRNYGLVLAMALCMLCWLAGIGISLDGIVHPRDPANRSSFAAAILHVTANPVLQMTVISLVFFFAGIRLPRARAVLFSMALSVAYLVCRDRFALFSARVSFDSRILVLSLPILIGLSVWILPKFPLTTRESLWFSAMLALPVAVDVAGTDVWHDFAQKVQVFAASQDDGFVPASVHRLNRHPASWNWTFPSLSIVLAAPHVGSILENSKDVKWQPFDPKAELPLPAFAGYGQSLASRLPKSSPQRIFSNRSVSGASASR